MLKNKIKLIVGDGGCGGVVSRFEEGIEGAMRKRKGRDMEI